MELQNYFNWFPIAPFYRGKRYTKNSVTYHSYQDFVFGYFQFARRVAKVCQPDRKRMYAKMHDNRMYSYSSKHTHTYTQEHKPVFNIIAGDSSSTTSRVRRLSPRLASRNRTFQPPSYPLTPSRLHTTLLTATRERFTVLLINWVQPNFSRFRISVLLRFIVIFMVLAFFLSTLYCCFAIVIVPA